MSNTALPIGVFDSGIGGLSVLQALRAELPHEDFVYLDDSGHAPYGERGEAFVLQRSRVITAQLRQGGIKALVIACNTATAAAVAMLRAEHPGLPIVGVEPALRPALAVSQTGRIGVMATRGTLTSAKFQALMGAVADPSAFVLQPCDGLADAIGRVAHEGHLASVQALCARYTRAMGRFGSSPGDIDTLVLGCTHYVLVQELLQSLVGPQVRLLSTGEPVARQTRRLLQEAAALTPPRASRMSFRSTGDPRALQAALARWLPEAGVEVALCCPVNPG